MPMLSATEIADMRSEQNDTMPDTVVVWRYTTASDGMGGALETYAAVGTVTGRLAPAGRAGDERIIAERVTATDPWVITVPNGTTVYERDRHRTILADKEGSELAVSAQTHAALHVTFH